MQLAALSNQLWPVIQRALRIADTPECPIFEPDDTWTRIVLHSVPLPVWDNKRDHQMRQDIMIKDLCHANSLPEEAVRQVHWLCCHEEVATRIHSSTAATPTFVSIMVALLGPNTATPLRKCGAVISGTCCRVTSYKECDSTHKEPTHLS